MADHRAVTTTTNIWSNEIPIDDFSRWLSSQTEGKLGHDYYHKLFVSKFASPLLDGNFSFGYEHAGFFVNDFPFPLDRRPINYETDFHALWKEVMKLPNRMGGGSRYRRRLHTFGHLRDTITFLQQYKKEHYPTLLRKRERDTFVQFLLSTRHPESTSAAVLGNKEVTGILMLIRSFLFGSDEESVGSPPRP